MSTEIEITIDMAARRRRGERPKKAPGPPQHEPTPRVSRLMALAIKFQDMVDRGEVHDYADIARLGYVTRARLTQIMNLSLLAPDIQEELLIGESARISERDWRPVAKHAAWSAQRKASRVFARQKR